MKVYEVFRHQETRYGENRKTLCYFKNKPSYLDLMRVIPSNFRHLVPKMLSGDVTGYEEYQIKEIEVNEN